MKYHNFFLKLIAFAVIGGILMYYQSVAVARAAVVAEREAKIAEVEEYNRKIQIENARREAAAMETYYENGTYEGEGNGYGGPIRVSVTIEYDILTDVHVVSHDAEDPAYYAQAESLLKTVLEKQSTDVDTVAGATFSSKGIIAGINDALDQAVKN